MQLGRPPQPASSGIPYRPHTEIRGFALVATLALLGLVVACTVMLVNLLRLQVDRVEMEFHRKLARQQAQLALELAIAQLQSLTGTDQVITMPAATLFDSTPDTLSVTGVEHPHWTWAFQIPNGRTGWLVSGSAHADPRKPISTEASVILVGPGSADPVNAATWVRAPKVVLPDARMDDARTGAPILQSYAYWTGELNIRAALALKDPLPKNDSRSPQHRSYLQLAQVRRSALEGWHPETDPPDSPLIQDRMARTEVDPQLFFLNPDRNALRQSYHDVTARTYSVLSNAIEGGLKVNLSDPAASVPGLTAEIRSAIVPTSTPSPPLLWVQGDAVEARFASGETLALDRVLPHATPILTEFSLSMGLFHTQSDRRHRLRYHLHAEWFNPYPADMVFQHERALLLLVDHLPRLEIRNQSSGQAFITDLNAIPPELRYNDLSKSKIHAWMEFDRLSDGSASEPVHGIDAGRIYRMSEPDKIRQPQGLARTLQETPHRWRWGGAAAPESGLRPPNTVYGNDTIRVRSLDPVSMTLSVIALGDGQRMPTNQHPDAFAAEKGLLLQLQHIPFPNIDLRLSGSSYSRSTSGSFNPNDYRLAFHFKLNEADPSLWATLAESVSFRSPQVDFSDPVIRSLYQIADVAAAARSADPLTVQERFWDDSDRSNSVVPDPEAWQMFLYDVPQFHPVSLGVFSHLHFHRRPHLWIGSPQANASPLNAIWDRAYFSGAPLEASSTAPQSWHPNAAHARRFENLRLVPVPDQNGQFPDATRIASGSGAAHCLIEGGFNLFSASPLAWSIVLKNQVSPASLPQLVHSNPLGSSIANGFSRLPQSAFRLGPTFSDATLPETRRNRLLYRQGVRLLDGVPGDPDADLRSLSQHLVREIRQAVAARTPESFPITSLHDLIQLGTIDRAIRRATRPGDGARIHHDSVKGPSAGDIDPLNPGFLRQQDLLAQLGDRLSVRSDTFVIRCYGESRRSGDGRRIAKAWAEAVVQRFPDYVHSSEPAAQPARDPLNLQLGRRYRILQFRWLQAHEI